MAPKAAFTLAMAFSAILASAATIDKRIVKGEDAKDGEIKFIVSVRDENKTHQCGGSLLDGYTVLTAAHCIHYGPKLVYVTAGTVDSKTGGVEAQVASFKKHPNYEPSFDDDEYWLENVISYEENDIAILKLSTPIENSNTIEYATLPPTGSDAVVNSTAIAAGCRKDADLQDRGAQSPKDIYSEDEYIPAKKLSKVVLPIHAREDCAQYAGVGDRDTIICAGGEGKNVCNADSGGPLFDQKTGQLLGVVSWSIMADQQYCNRAPGLFTRVGTYIDFINENLGPASDHNGDGVR
ncbi:peptidase S1 domain protein [Metarhizium robertsii]|uniref:Peptidase S1 domain protein n=1 Tax=Metarhizium robertsii TaxID=568076 RepID=A0A014P0F5_9HYPO|nr:peptidase S1 domain protein [Metarhizium robertsii]